MKEMSAALNERNKENRQDNIHNLDSNHNNNDGETQALQPGEIIHSNLLSCGLSFGFRAVNVERIYISE